MFLKPILVAIDFASPSDSILKFADRIAQYLQLDLHIVYTYKVGITHADAFDVDPIVIQKSSFQSDLETYVQNADLKSNVSKVQAVQGFATTILEEMSAHASMLVMGTIRSVTFMDRIFGSVSTSVAHNAQCPVWLIPNSYAGGPIESMVFANDWNGLNLSVAKKSKELLMTLGIDATFVHVKTQDEVYDFDELQNDIWTYFPAAEIDIVENDSIVAGLYEYVDKHNINGLIIVNRHERSMLERMFTSSTTNKLIFERQTPLLIFQMHEDKTPTTEG